MFKEPEARVCPNPDFPHVPDHLLAKEYTLDPNYEYIQITISEVTKSIIKGTLERVQKGDLDPENPSAQMVNEFVLYFDDLQKTGWQPFEISGIGTLNEVRRLRRKK